MANEEKIKYIVFIAAVNKESIGKLRVAITEAINSGYNKLYFLISSGGGNVVEGLNIAAFIKSLSVETIMHNIGQVDSVANVIFTSAKKRCANNNASFLFHGISMNFEKANFNFQQLSEQLQIAERLEENIAQNVASYIEVEIEKIKELMSRSQKIVSVDEAKTLRIVHEIKDVKIPQGAEVVSIGNT